MRINKFVALATGISRRAADKAVDEGKVSINGQLATPGSTAEPGDTITYEGQTISIPDSTTTIMMNKPYGYVCSRDGQGSPTIYDLLPDEFKQLKSIGRLDKNSTGLILLTNDGDLANELTHPSNTKSKIYHVELDKPLIANDERTISHRGVRLDDGLSKIALEPLDASDRNWEVQMHEGRNRQIRRTFEAVGYEVKRLNRIQFGQYKLTDLAPTQTFATIN